MLLIITIWVLGACVGIAIAVAIVREKGLDLKEREERLKLWDVEAEKLGKDLSKAIDELIRNEK